MTLGPAPSGLKLRPHKRVGEGFKVCITWDSVLAYTLASARLTRDTFRHARGFGRLPPVCIIMLWRA